MNTRILIYGFLLIFSAKAISHVRMHTRWADVEEKWYDPFPLAKPSEMTRTVIPPGVYVWDASKGGALINISTNGVNVAGHWVTNTAGSYGQEWKTK